MAHRMRNIDEVLPEFAGHVFVGAVFLGQLERNGQEIKRVHGHPARAVGLFDVAAGGQRRAPIKDADVVQAQESALKNIHAARRPCGSPTR